MSDNVKLSGKNFIVRFDYTFPSQYTYRPLSCIIIQLCDFYPCLSFISHRRVLLSLTPTNCHTRNEMFVL